METTVRLETTRIPVTPDITVGAVLGVPEWWPTGTRAAVVLAHDAGSNMENELLVSLHRELANRGYLSLRFNFPHAEQRRKRPDPAPLLERTFKQAAALLALDPSSAPSRLVVGGIGLGAQIAAQSVATGLKVDGLACMSFPLHPVGKPMQTRAEALYRIICPILFMQGTHDATCRVDRLNAALRKIGAPTTVRVLEDADHGLEAIRRGSRSTLQVRAEAERLLLEFVARVTGTT
jgi:predicted alpha/beta-hydrolase family hydrolase